jgi:hypothetical protein
MRHLSFSALLLVTAFVLSSCSGVPGGGCVANCPSGATVSLVLTATPPSPSSQLSIQAFTATITGISLTPSSGTSVPVALTTSSYVAEFNRVTSDSTLLASNVSIPGGNYNAMVVTFSSPRVTFCTQPNPGVAGCAAGTLTSVTGNAGSVTVSTNLSIANNQLTGLAVNVNLGTALTQNGQAVTGLDLTAANAVSASTLPSSSNDLTSGQLAHLDDIMGLVTSVSGSTVTIQTSTRGSVIATANSSTVFDCPAANSTCVVSNQIAVMDGILNSNGTITMTFFQPIIASVDWLEGVVATVPSSVSNRFTIVATDAVPATSNSLISGRLNLGDQIVVTLAGSVTPFAIVDKGLGQTLPVNTFNGSTSVSAIFPGMTVAFPVTSFSAQSGATPGATTTTTFLLRFTRVSTAVVTPSLPDFSTSGSDFPPFFGITGNQQMRTTTGRLSVDGAAGLTSVPVGNTISASALYLGPNALPQFAAQSVRAR